MEDTTARLEGHKRFSRFVDLVSSNFKTPEKDIVDPQDRVEFIKNKSSEDFFDLLSISNSLLRDEKRQRWGGKAVRTQVGSFGGGAIDLDPPDNAEKEFEVFYKQMQEGISGDNINLWAAKLYTAIVFSHMFPDGNGRLARNFYFLLRFGKVLGKEASIDRTYSINEYAERLNREAILQIFQNDGIAERKSVDELEDTYSVVSRTLMN